MNRWMRYELIVLDEMAYVAMPDAAAELLFQVIAGRAERAAVIVTTNLPFSEWTTMFPNARLCKAMVDRSDGPGAHHRYRERVIPVPADDGEEQGSKTMSEPKPRRGIRRG